MHPSTSVPYALSTPRFETYSEINRCHDFSIEGGEFDRVMVKTEIMDDEDEITQPPFKKMMMDNNMEHSSPSSSYPSTSSKSDSVPVIVQKPVNTTSQKFSSAFKLTEENICPEAIEVILKDSLEGLAVLAEYNSEEKILSQPSRDTLVRLLINRCPITFPGSTNRFFQRLSEVITLLFPNEPSNIYYVAPYTDGNNTKNAKGKLPDRWRNMGFLLRKHNVIPKKVKPIAAAQCPTVPPNDDVRCHQGWLAVNREPLDEVEARWVATYTHRATNSGTRKLITQILENEWPILKSPMGPRLIEFDFKQRWPEKDLLLKKKWEAFFQKLYTVRKSSIRDNRGKLLCAEYNSVLEPNSDQADRLRILLLPYLIPPTSKMKTNIGMKKPTIQECAEGFAISIKTTNDISIAIENRNARYEMWKEPAQPCIVFVAEDATKVPTSYMSLGTQLWLLSSPIQALDTLFKLHLVLNLAYAKDCEQIWVLIQHYIFEIRTEYDKSFPIVKALMASLGHTGG